MNTSIIESRPDFAAIAAWIPQGSSVLDLGCGDGSLLRYLRETRDVRGYGVEISDANIAACIANNVNVIQNDLESGIADFETDSFDFVILSQTLQATRHTEALMKEIVQSRTRRHRQLPQLRLLEESSASIVRQHARVRRAAVSVVRHAECPPVHAG